MTSRSDVIPTCKNYRCLGYERVLRGIYTPIPDSVGSNRAQPLDWQIRALRALAGMYQGEVFPFGITALQCLGVDIPNRLQDSSNFHVCMQRGTRWVKRRGVTAHPVTDLPTASTHINGIPFLNPVDHWIQVRGATPDELVEIGDGLMRRQSPLVSLADLHSRLAELSGCTGIKAVRRIAPLVAPGTDSITETRLRLVIVRAGLPVPTINLPIPYPRAGRVYHVDLGYRKERIAVEYDGAVHVGDARQMEIDAARRRHLQDLGWLIITVTRRDLANPQEFLMSIENALIVRRSRAF